MKNNLSTADIVVYALKIILLFQPIFDMMYFYYTIYTINSHSRKDKKNQIKIIIVR
jgi:hypothetical protein